MRTIARVTAPSSASDRDAKARRCGNRPSATIPRIVTDVLTQVRDVEPDVEPDDGDDADGIGAGLEPDLTAAPRPARTARRRGLTRLLRPFRQAAEA